MRKRPIFLVALSAAVGLLSWMNAQGQAPGKPKTKAEIEAWSKAHPNEATTPVPVLSNQPSERVTSKTEEPVKVESAKAKKDLEAESNASTVATETKAETKQAQSVSTYSPTMKDSEIPAHQRQASDYQNPAVRARLEKDLKAAPKAVQAPAPAKSGLVAVNAQEEKLPAGWPSYRDTGNPSADEAAYNKAKDDWYNNQDPEYHVMQEKVRVAREEEAAKQRLLDEEAAREAAEIAKKQNENQSTKK